MKEIKSEINFSEFEREIKSTEQNINQEIKPIKAEIDMSSDINSVSNKIESSTQEINKAYND